MIFLSVHAGSVYGTRQYLVQPVLYLARNKDQRPVEILNLLLAIRVMDRGQEACLRNGGSGRPSDCEAGRSTAAGEVIRAAYLRR